SELRPGQKDALEGGHGAAQVAIGDLRLGEAVVELEIVGGGEHLFQRYPRAGGQLTLRGFGAALNRAYCATSMLPRLIGVLCQNLRVSYSHRCNEYRRAEQRAPYGLGKHGNAPRHDRTIVKSPEP